MSTKITLIALSFIVALLSCQKEYTNIDEPDKSTTIIADDNIADLISKMVLKDGSFDNIIDRCSEISIKFPYAVSIEEQLIQISSREDIEEIKQNYFHLRDDIDISYPVTVSFSDYSELVLTNADELEEIQEQYNTTLEDDDIECLNFIYPIEITLYNTLYQSSETVVVTNDYDTYSIFSDMDNLVLEISFPIQIESLNQDTITIHNNDELEDEIEKIIDNCDEEDEVEFDEEDYPYIDLLTSNTWEVALFSDTTNETSSFNQYIFDFKPDYTIQVQVDTETIYGAWELNIDTIAELEIEFDTDETPLIWLNQEWVIKSKSSDLIEMEAESEFEGFIMRLDLIKSR